MGGLVSSIFGGSSKKSSSTSGNYNNDIIKNSLSPLMNQGAAGGLQLSDLLGLNGQDAGAQAGARADFRNTPGYQFALQEGSNAIGSNAAARGMFQSGATGKALSKFGTGLADQTYQNYMQNLLGLTQAGTQAGGVISDAGKFGTSSESGSSSTGGLGKALGFGLSILSDPRLKKNLEKIGEVKGLNVYSYTYLWDDVPQVGFRADEVKMAYPAAVETTAFGYDRVNYGMILNHA
jgi:hypothetical protein